jgi:hypothetical protein
VISLDSLVIKITDEQAIAPRMLNEGILAVVSKDLKEWKELTFYAEKKMTIDLTRTDSVRYICIHRTPVRISEISGYKNNKQVDRSSWRASNLFQDYDYKPFTWDYHGFAPKKAWSNHFTLTEIPAGSYLCIAINGKHGAEKAFAALEVDGKLVGCPDRSPSYMSNAWEYVVARSDANYTYYVPLTKDMIGKDINAFVLASDDQAELKPEVWITAYPDPYEAIGLKLLEKK